MFCPSCGSEIDKDSQYCKYCGISLGDRTQGQQPPKAVLAAKSSVAPRANAPHFLEKSLRWKGWAIGLIFVMCFGATFGIWTAVTWGDFSTQQNYAIPATASAYDNITVNVDVSTSSITLAFVNNQSGAPLVSGQYNQILRGGLLYGDYAFSANMTGTTVNIDQTGQVWLMFGQSSISTTVNLLTNTSYTINLASSTGDVSVTIPAGTRDQQVITASATTGKVVINAQGTTIADKIEATATTGQVQVLLTDVNVTGDVIARTTTGDVDVNTTNCSIGGNVISSATTGNVRSGLASTLVKGNFEYTLITGDLTLGLNNITIANSNQLLWANATTGNVNLLIQQGVELGGNLSCAIQAVTGDVTVTYTGTAGLATGFQASAQSTGSGDKVMHPTAGYSTASGNSIETNNYSSVSSTIIAANVTTTTGDINLAALPLM